MSENANDNLVACKNFSKKPPAVNRHRRFLKTTALGFLIMLSPGVALVAGGPAAAGNLLPILSDNVAKDAAGGRYETSATGDIALRAINGGSITSLGGVHVITGTQNGNGVEAESGATITLLNSDTVTSNGIHAYGLEATGVGSKINSAAEITTTQHDAYGIHGRQSGTVVQTGSSVTTQGDYSDALHADSTGRIESSAYITTAGKQAYGANAVDGGTILLKSGTQITTTGANASAIRAGDAGSSVTAAGSSSGITLSTSGDAAYGAQAFNGASITIDNNTAIRTRGLNSSGLRAENAGSTVTSGANIRTIGDRSHGVDAIAQGRVILTAGAEIQTSGNNSYGIRSLGAALSPSVERTLVTGVVEISTGGDNSYGVFANESGEVILSAGSRVYTAGPGAHGLVSGGASPFVSGSPGASIIVDGVTITTTGANSDGALARDGGSITLSGDSTLTTRGAGSNGLEATGSGSLITSTAAISTEQNSAYGIRATHSGQVVQTGGSVSTKGDYSDALHADNAGRIESSAHITTDGKQAYGADAVDGGIILLGQGTQITTTGANASAIRAGYADSSLTVAGTAGSSGEITISTAGVAAYGAEAFAGASITLDNHTSISTAGASSSGLHAENAGSIVTSGAKIQTSGEWAYGVDAIAQASITLTAGSEIRTSGDNAYGIRSLGAALSPSVARTLVTGLAEVRTEGDYAYGVFASESGAVVLSAGSSVYTTGQGAHGLVSGRASPYISDSPGASIVADGITVITTGANSDAAVVQDGGSLTLSGNSTLTAQGAGSNGLSLRGYDGTLSTATLTDTTISSTDGVSIFADSGRSSVSLSHVTAVVNNGNWLQVEVTDPLDPGSADITVVADGSTLTGAAVTKAGNTSTVSLVNGTTWNLTGNSSIASLTNDNSTIRFANITGDVTLPSSYRTLTVHDYVGNRGTLSMNTYLGNDNSPSDRLVVDGGTATGTTLLDIRASGGQGAKSSGDGIVVVQALNGATTNTGVNDHSTFQLAHRVAVGAYEYYLAANGKLNTDDQNWYLRGYSLNDDRAKPEDGKEPRPEVPTNASIMTLSLQYGYALAGSASDRNGGLEPGALGAASLGAGSLGAAGAVFEERSVWCKGRTAQNPNVVTDPNNPFKCAARVPVASDEGIRWARSGWAYAIGGRGVHNQNNYFQNGPDYNVTFGGFKAGLDIFANEQSGGSLDKAGFYVGYGKIMSDVFSPQGAHYGHKAGTVEMDAYSAGAYWTHYSTQGWYADATVQGTWYTNTAAKSILNETISPDGFGILGSLEGGYQFKFGSGWTLTPQAQIAYENVTFGDMRDSFGAFAFRDGDSLRGRVGARIAKNWNLSDAVQPRVMTTWLRANVWHEFVDGAKTSVLGFNGESPLTTPSSLKGTWGEVSAGVGAQITSNISLYAIGDYQHSLDNKGVYGWDGKLGLNVKW